MALPSFILRKILKAVKSADKTTSGSRITELRLFVYNLHFCLFWLAVKNSQKVVVHTRQILRSLRAGIMPVWFFHLDLRCKKVGYQSVYRWLNFFSCKGRPWRRCTPALARQGDQRSRGGVTGSLVCLRFSSLLQARVSIKNSAVVFPSRHNFLAVFTDSKLRKIQERTPKSNV